MAYAGTQLLAWDRVHFSFGVGAVLPNPATVEHVVTQVLDNFLAMHSVEGEFPSHVCRLRMASGKTGVKQVYPAIESVLDMGDALVARRVQMSCAPCAVRTANAMLCATISKQRVVVHYTWVGDVELGPDAHAAALYVALTRVPTIATVAFINRSA